MLDVNHRMMNRKENTGGRRVRYAGTTSISGGLIVLVLATFLVASTATTRHVEAQATSPTGAEITEGDVVLITGSTDGLGREVARSLAATGAHVIVHGRNHERGTALVDEIERETPGTARFYAADLASLDQVRAFADAILQDYDRLDLLVNNAGIWLPGPGERRLSEDGHELHFAINYLSHFLLTSALLPLLAESAPSRIINVASGAQTPIDFDDVMMESNYDGSRAYAQSKLAQVLFTVELAPRLEEMGVSVYSLHPASLMDTPMVRGAGREPRSTVEEGVESVLNAVTTTESSGQYFNGTRPARANDQAYDEEARRRLWDLSERLTALD